MSAGTSWSVTFNGTLKASTTNTTSVMNGDKTVTATFTNEVIPEFPQALILAVCLIAMVAVATGYRNKISKQSKN